MDIPKILNNSQLLDISKNLDGISKKSNKSVFSLASRLDANTNESLETKEVSVTNLLSLGNKILNSLATMFGIDVSDSTTPQQMESFEDIQNDSIVKNHFDPLIQLGQGATVEDVKNGQFEGLLTEQTVVNTIDSIIEEKAAQGIEVTERTDNIIKFSDGSQLSILRYKNPQDNLSSISSMTYENIATDGSKSMATITVTPEYNSPRADNISSVRIEYIDGNAPTQEIIDQNTEWYEYNGSNPNIKYEATVNFKEINKHDFAERISQDMMYYNNGEQSYLTVGEDHTQGTGEGWKYLDPAKQKEIEYYRREQ